MCVIETIEKATIPKPTANTDNVTVSVVDGEKNEDTDLRELMLNPSHVNLPESLTVRKGLLKVSLIDGTIYTRNSIEEPFVKDGTLSKPSTLTYQDERLRFYFYIFIAQYIESIPIKRLQKKLCEASIYSRRKNERGTSCLNKPRDLDKSDMSILLQIWKSTKRAESKLLIVGDDSSAVKYYVYTGEIPTFKCIPPIEAKSLIQRFFHYIFNEIIPKEIDRNVFFSEFLKYMNIHAPVSKKYFYNDILRNGVNFKNGFVCVEDRETRHKLISYDEKFSS